MSTNTLYIDSPTKESTWFEFLFSYIERNSEKEQLFQWKDILTCQLAFIYFYTSCKKPKMSYILLVFRDLALDINKSKTFYTASCNWYVENIQFDFSQLLFSTKYVIILLNKNNLSVIPHLEILGKLKMRNKYKSSRVLVFCTFYTYFICLS